jgi:hypothetical protein
MSAIIAATLMLSQIAVTDARRTDEQIPVSLTMTCALSNDASFARQVDLDFHGSIGAGPGVRVTLTHGADAGIDVPEDHDSVMLNSADDHTQNQIFNQFVIRVDGRKYVATLSIDYPAAMPRPASFDNSVAIEAAKLELGDLKNYRSVAMGGENIYMGKMKNPPVYALGNCALRDASVGSAG